MLINETPKGLMIMIHTPRTTITAADGTTYIEIGAARKRLRRTLILIAGAMITPFFLAACIGIAIGADRIMTSHDKVITNCR